MPEIDNNQTTGENTENKGVGAGEGQSGADDKNNSNATGNGEGANAGKGTNGDGGDNDDADQDKGQDGDNKGKAKAPKTQDDDEDDGSEPEQRKRLSSKDFIIQRQQKKLAKKAKAKEDNPNDDDDNEGSNDDDDIAPEDEELITKVVAKKFAPIIDKSLAADDETEIQDFLKTNPDFKPFEAKVRRYMQHPSRRALPIKSIFYEVAGDKLLKIGAERAQQADKKAKDSQTGGGSNRGGEDNQNVWDLTPEQFAERQEKIRRGQA